jgi:hypothetical protein
LTDKLTTAETTVAVLLTIVAIWLRLFTAFSAGALWRDEANTVALATFPSVGDVWRNLQYDSFPILWLIFVRVFSAVVGPMNDAAFRALGFVVGAGMVACLWWYARTFRVRMPLVSLLLVGLSPSVIVWGDSVRAYGTGIVLMLISGILLWRYIERSTVLRFLLAAIAALASVHTLFYNPVLLIAFGLGALAVCFTRNDYKTALGVIAIGFVAAISLVVYVPSIRAAAKWNDLVRMPHYTIGSFWEMLGKTLEPVGHWQIYFWTGLSILALVVGLWTIRTRTATRESRAQREIVLFSTLTLLASVIGVFVFLRALSYPTQPWYYISMLVIAAVCIDAIAGTIVLGDVTREILIAGVSAVAVVTVFPAIVGVSPRMTRVDRIAAQLANEGNSKDFVVVNPWFIGVTFDRYYRGRAPWETVPPIGFHAFHRYDIVKARMLSPDQHLAMVPLENQMRAALSSGHRVFVVGDIPDSTQFAVIDRLLAGPRRANERIEGEYGSRWALMIARFLSAHATAIEQVSHNYAGWMVNRLESPRVLLATGWRP